MYRCISITMTIFYRVSTKTPPSFFCHLNKTLLFAALIRNPCRLRCAKYGHQLISAHYTCILHMRDESQSNPTRKVGRGTPRNSPPRAKTHVFPFYGRENKFNFAHNTQGVHFASGNIPPPCRTLKCARGERFC